MYITEILFLDNPQTQIACTSAVTTETEGVQFLMCKEGFEISVQTIPAAPEKERSTFRLPEMSGSVFVSYC